MGEGDLVEAPVGQLPGDLHQKGLHILIGRIQPVAAVFIHPQCAAGQGKPAGLMIQGKHRVREGGNLGDEIKTVVGEVGDHLVDDGNGHIRFRRTGDGGGIIEVAEDALELNHDGTGLLNCFDLLKHLIRLLQHGRGDIVAAHLLDGLFHRRALTVDDLRIFHHRPHLGLGGNGGLRRFLGEAQMGAVPVVEDVWL